MGGQAKVSLEELATFPELRDLRELTLNRSRTDMDTQALIGVSKLTRFGRRGSRMGDRFLQSVGGLES